MEDNKKRVNEKNKGRKCIRTDQKQKSIKGS